MGRYLVAGCAGFIGARTTQRLLDTGHEVVGIDSLNDAYDRKLKDWRLGQTKGRKGFSFLEVDITDRSKLREAFEDGPLDGVINLAAYAGVRYSVENPWIYYETNVTGSLNLLEACRDADVGKFVLASSSSVYGAGNPVPFREDAQTSAPLSPYAASKKAAEELCYSYHHLFGIDVSVLRFFTVYGPASRPDMSPFRFVQWISEGRPLTLYGDGSQQRDFTYVDDIARGAVCALQPVGYEIINLGSDTPIVLMDFIRLIERLLGREAVIEKKTSHSADMEVTWAEISKARDLLGWEPEWDLEGGVSRLVAWYQEHHEWTRAVRTKP